MKKLFKTADRKGIRIILDLVAGHTSIEHPWFKKSCEPQKNKYSNWYIWTDSVWDWSVDRTHAVGYSLLPVLGYSQRDANFLTNYFWFQPALNYGFAKPDSHKKWQLPVNHPTVKAVRNEMKRIMRFWLDMGASGFRCDMAGSLIKGDVQWKQTTELWKDIRGMFDREYPEAAIIAEWFYPPAAIDAMFHLDFVADGKVDKVPAYSSLFRKEKSRSIMFDRGHSFFDALGRGNIMEFIEIYFRHYNLTKGRGYISFCSGNHDCPRISIGRSRRELELVFVFLMTMPGVPFIYYGDEIGMRNLDLPSKEGAFHRTGARTPMQWNKLKNAGFSTASKNKLYLPIDTRADRPNVASQENDPHSLLNHVRRLITLRKQNQCLCAEGDFAPLYAKSNKYPLVYVRRFGKMKMVIALNPSQQKVDVNIHCDNIRSNWALEMGSGVAVQNENCTYRLKMNGISYGIFCVS
jgi:maltose alpha-D-glucosyltransferase/alpha-amylase